MRQAAFYFDQLVKQDVSMTAAFSGTKKNPRFYALLKGTSLSCRHDSVLKLFHSTHTHTQTHVSDIPDH